MSTTVNKLTGATDSEKLAHLCSLNYKQQAVWFLNAFWDQYEGEAEKVWKSVQLFSELDHQKHGEGAGLDELGAHRFLEQIGETHTVSHHRDRLRKTGAIGQTERPKTVPLTHYLLWRYEVDWHVLVNTSGDNSEEIAEAQRLLDSVSAAFQEAEHQAQLSREAEAHARAQEAAAVEREAQAKQREAEAKQREAEAKEREAQATERENQALEREAQAKNREQEAKETEAEALNREAQAREQEAPFKEAQEEVDSALADVKSQESTRDSRTAELQRKSSEGGVVQQNKAKAELAQHLAEDPLPLRKAKITLEAALKRAEKARAPFEAATKIAEAARREAEAAREAAEAARREAETARKVAEAARKEAVAAREQAEAAREEAEAARRTAEAARHDAEESRRAAEEQRLAAEESLAEAGRKVEEAEAFLAEVKAKPGKCHGAIWWMEKELEEQKKYLPASKGGITKRA